jgi:hypothetical protein
VVLNYTLVELIPLEGVELTALFTRVGSTQTGRRLGTFDELAAGRAADEPKKTTDMPQLSTLGARFHAAANRAPAAERCWKQRT